MPDRRGDAVVPFEVKGRVCVTVDEVKFRIPLRVPRSRVNMETTEVSAPLKIEVWASVDEFLLVPEDNKSSLGNLDTKNI